MSCVFKTAFPWISASQCHTYVSLALLQFTIHRNTRAAARSNSIAFTYWDLLCSLSVEIMQFKAT